MNVWKGILVFTLGAAVGVAVSWKILEKKCNKIIEEEVASVKRAFKQKDENANEKTENTPDTETSVEDNEYQKLVDNLGYSKGITDRKPVAYVISPDQFGEFKDYERASLTMYSDGVVAWDIDDKLVMSPEIMLGEGSLDKFGEYEDGVLHVRNEDMKMDFEISEDIRTYAEVYGSGVASDNEE